MPIDESLQSEADYFMIVNNHYSLSSHNPILPVAGLVRQVWELVRGDGLVYNLGRCKSFRPFHPALPRL
jgi:hypothetical protein